MLYVLVRVAYALVVAHVVVQMPTGIHAAQSRLPNPTNGPAIQTVPCRQSKDHGSMDGIIATWREADDFDGPVVVSAIED
jgi:hypothetical protein